MGVRDESPRSAERLPAPDGHRAEPQEALPDLPDLPDLLELDLEQLRTLQHPVLNEVLADLRERALRPSEMLWGFSSSF